MFSFFHLELSITKELYLLLIGLACEKVYYWVALVEEKNIK